jgi:hypothetical protein
MRGQSNLVVPSVEVQPLYRGTLNSYSAISDTGLTQNNRTGTQALANTTLNAATPDGILGGSVVAIVGPAQVGPAKAAQGVLAGIVGIAQRNAAGEAYESTSSAASGAITYIHGSDTLVSVPVFETADTAGTALDYSAAAGLPVYASANGLLTIAAGLATGAAAAGATIVGILVDPPTATNPVMVVQLRI